MKKVLLSIVALSIVVPMMAKSDADPVLMTVDGKDIHVSEFVYLYGKNSGQQPKMTVDEYLDLFTVYKLKVADAKCAGIDTTQSFRNEYNLYRSDLAKPYLKDSELVDAMVAEAYGHKTREVDVSHIMVAKGNSPESSERQIALLDSLRNTIINGADFGETARKYSIDRAVVRNNGHMGWLMADRVPYSFEKAAYDTPVGEISEVVETPFGYHIVRVEAERPASGEVLAQHILKLTQGHGADEIPAIKATIDSIYAVLTSAVDSVDFSDVARIESEDPGSASKGGMLPWFGRGRMVPEFEEVAFSLNIGEISKPFSTSYGYHIVKRLDYRGISSLEEVRPSILESMSKDGRMMEIEQRRQANLRNKYDVKVNESSLEELKKKIASGSGLDSSLIVSMRTAPISLGSIGNVVFTTGDILPGGVQPVENVSNANTYIDELIEDYIAERLNDLEIDRLERENPEFRNILREYYDGILLFDISNKRVWEASANDDESLEQYFDQHRDRYSFDSPKYKGYIIYSSSDSVYNVINKYLADNKPTPDQVGEFIHDNFPKEAKIGRVLAGKGANKYVDASVFGGKEPEMKGRYKHYELYGGEVIDRPEEISDVRANVTADYQADLEQKWIAELKSKYPVKINKNRLKKLR